MIGASLPILDMPNNPPQRRDPGLNPIILIPVSQDIDMCDELMAMRDSLFPPRAQVLKRFTMGVPSRFIVRCTSAHAVRA